MNKAIRSLIDTIRRGQYEDPSEKIAQLVAAMLENPTDAALVAYLLQAPQVPLRLAALRFLCERPADAVAEDLLPKVEDGESRVREALAEVAAKMQGPSSEEILRRLFDDADPDVREKAVAGGAGRPALTGRILERLRRDEDWSVRLAAAKACAGDDVVSVGPAFLQVLATDSDADVRFACAGALERALEKDPAFLPSEAVPPVETLNAAAKLIAGFDRVPLLKAWIAGRNSGAVNLKELARFGTDLTAQAESGTLSHGHRLDRAVATLAARILAPKARSVALLGKSGTGKTTLVHELVHHLARPENGAWRILRMSPTDFMAGTRYAGDWETKLAELVEAVRRPRKVLLYIPNLSDLAAMGRWSKSDANVAAALAPYLEDGSVLVLGESTAEEYERGLGADLALRRLFERVLVEEPSAEETRGILSDIRGTDEALVPDPVLHSLQEMCEAFLGHLSRPGNSVPLFRAVLAAAKERGRPARRRDVLETLSVSTGIPADLLDDSSPLDTAALQSFFQTRILGQDEAVSAVVDTVTLIKAGLTDPNKPFGVLLFVGPTGVGKTELARALAEYIFGDANRLLRFDMSEFAGSDSFTRLIGGRGEGGLLTDAVSQRPFSVVLLDEIEKSHVNVFDLCLQLFDAGRLTDGRGRTTDFRRTIVILTSNVGAESTSTPLGFGRTEANAEADAERTMKELGRFFRPEFLNRIDRIVGFRGLTMETAERIARRELDLVLQRSGIQRRGLTVDIAPEVVALIVREGYSRQFGARPVKRTVERLALMPLARALASGGADSGSLVHLRAEGNGVKVTVQSAPKGPAPAPKARRPRPATTAAGALLERARELEPRILPWLERKSRLLETTRDPAFHRDAANRERTFDEIGRIDRFGARIAAVRDGLLRLQSGSEPDEAGETLAELESELGHLERVVGSADQPAGLADAWILLTRTASQGQAIEAVDSLVGTYLGLATRRSFEAETCGALSDGKNDVALLEVSGLGAAGLFSGEAGLHEFHRRRRQRNVRSGREETFDDTTLVRVEVVPALGDPPPRFGTTLGLKVSPAGVNPRLGESPAFRVSGFHAPSIRSLTLDFAGSRGTAADRATRFFHGLVQSASDRASETVVRRYDIGIGSRIKDLRSGRTTTRLAQFFRGRVDLPASG